MRSVRMRKLIVALVTAFACSAFIGPGQFAHAGDVSPTPQTSYTTPQSADLSALSWSDAFHALVTKMSAEYAFTGWKAIDWPALERRYAPRIAAAEAAGDVNAYYLALRSFIHHTRDGHVSIGARPEIAEQFVAGGFGLIASRVDSGAVVATWVDPDGPAWASGVRVGSRIVRWNHQQVDRALATTSTVLSPQQPTDERRDAERLRLLVRAPIGSERTVAFTVPGRSGIQTSGLTAIDDGQRTLRMTSEQSVIASSGWPEKTVTSRILPGNIGYIRLLVEMDLPAEVPGDHTPTLVAFRAAIHDFIGRDVRGIVLDIRSNSGGSDQMTADILGSFYARPSFYEYQSYIVPSTGDFEIWVGDDDTGALTQPGGGLWITPAPEVFRGPVVALVNNATVSSGEGVAMGIKRLPNGTVVGFTGTNGSFGMVGDGVLMPGGWEIGWPFGQSLDASKVVQIDSRRGLGGVSPDLRIPHIVRNLAAHWSGEDVELAYGLRVLGSRAIR